MKTYPSYLKTIDKQRDWVLATLKTWSNIHSGTNNLTGLEIMREKLKEAFCSLGGVQQEIELPERNILQNDGTFSSFKLGKALSISKHPSALTRILFVGHMDIAYPANLPLERCELKNNDQLVGRGTADMKGGLLVMLLALKTLENSEISGRIGWEIFINSDEEIGSPGSKSFLNAAANRNHIGLVFEPSLPDGNIVGARKGSANFTVLFKGKSAHVGRDFFNGRNAVTAAARFALAAQNLMNSLKDITINIGSIQGGGPTNLVPDQAICTLNVRFATLEDLDLIKKKINQIIELENKQGVKVIFHIDSERPPKIFDKKTELLFEKLRECGKFLGLDLSWKDSGGVCDGNTLAAAGLTTLDTLGAVGGNLHTSEEYVSIDSILIRAKLNALLLMQLALREGEKKQ